MTVESFANGILRSAEVGDSRDYISDRQHDPVIQVVASLNRMKAERRVVQAETSECICYRLTEKGKIDIVAAEPDRLQILNGQISTQSQIPKRALSSPAPGHMHSSKSWMRL